MRLARAVDAAGVAEQRKSCQARETLDSRAVLTDSKPLVYFTIGTRKQQYRQGRARAVPALCLERR